MCGIVGIISQQDVTRLTLDRLATLEYRGYDSFGQARVTGQGDLVVDKAVGSVGEALRSGRLDRLEPATLALAHTRWATHGGVTEANSHPHRSYDGAIAVVHNGVIENHMQLRRKLEAEGIVFASETDTEVVTHLIARHHAAGLTLLDALARTVAELTGEYALGVISTTDPTTIYGAKHKSPLVTCFDGDHGVLASDPMALTGFGKDVVFLEDGDIVAITPTAATVHTLGPDGTLQPVDRVPVRLDEGHQAANKGEYPHWMIKEIDETPDAVEAALAVPASVFAGVVPADRRIVTLIGAGSAFYVAQIAQYLLAEFAGVRAIALASDEAAHLALLGEGDPLIAVSQSGETFDTLEVCRSAVTAGAVLTSISNVPNSTQERLAAHRLRQGCGPEICVLSTKSVIGQVVLLTRLAIETGHANGTLDDGRYQALSDSLARLPQTLRTFIAERSAELDEVARRYSHVEDWFVIGRGVLYPTACEGALKLKEVSYRHVEGAAAGFFKHGTISLIQDDFFTIALLPDADADHARYAATLAAVNEITARSGPVIGVGPANADPDDLRPFITYVALPLHGDNAADVTLQLVTGQLLAYFCALDLGREIDQPRSLAKSVTVR